MCNIQVYTWTRVKMKKFFLMLSELAKTHQYSSTLLMWSLQWGFFLHLLVGYYYIYVGLNFMAEILLLMYIIIKTFNLGEKQLMWLTSQINPTWLWMHEKYIRMQHLYQPVCFFWQISYFAYYCCIIR